MSNSFTYAEGAASPDRLQSAGQAAESDSNRAYNPNPAEEVENAARYGGPAELSAGVNELKFVEAIEARLHGEPAEEKAPRFRIFVIDTGWHSMARKVLHENLALFHELIGEDPAYVLDRDTSVALVRRHRNLIGQDPIICVHDLHEIRRRGTSGVHGMRLHLGQLHSENAVISAMQMLAHFLARYRLSDHFEAEVRRRLRLEGFNGAIKIIAGGTPQNVLLKI